jgi:hypothetical protein
MRKCLAAKRQAADYKALAERPRSGVDAVMATKFLSEGETFYEDAHSMSIFHLCPN